MIMATIASTMNNYATSCFGKSVINGETEFNTFIDMIGRISHLQSDALIFSNIGADFFENFLLYFLVVCHV